MGVHFELSDFPPETQKKIMRKFAEEDKRKAEHMSRQAVGNAPETPKPKNTGGNKYNAQKVAVILPDGTEHTFDSAKEHRRYEELMIMQRAGEISGLEIQVPYELIPKQKLSSGKTERPVSYIADFVYQKDGQTVVEDVKGYRKGQAYSVFVIKRKLMKYVHGIEITEI